MATQEKLMKALDVLKNVTPNQTFDLSGKKHVINNCHIIAECIANPTIKVATNFQTYLGATINVLLQLCDVKESDIKMTAEESLNRVIKALGDENGGKIQIELHKAIKRNGPAKSLRVALWRFAQLAHLIRPQKGKSYVANLLPVIIRIIEREDEQIHETLSNSLPKIMQALGSFTSDNEIKVLLKAFLNNVTNQSAVIRRTTANCILSICLHCRKPYVFIKFIIGYLLDLLIPVNDNQNTALILGVMINFKSILPHLKILEDQEYNLNITRENIQGSLEKFLQIYELCLYYFTYKDHNVVNAALETMNILLQNNSDDFRLALLNPKGINKSRIISSQFSSRSTSRLSVAAIDENIFPETELTETIRSDIEKWIDDSKLSVMNLNDSKTIELEKMQLNENASSSNDSTIASYTYDYERNDYTKSQSVGECLDKFTQSESLSEKSCPLLDDDKTSDYELLDIDPGSFLDKDVSLLHCTRMIVKFFLLSGHPGKPIPDKNVRVSVKSLALTCLGSLLKIHPKSLTIYLDRNSDNNKFTQQNVSDVLLFAKHSDPQLRGIIRVLISNFISTTFLESGGNYMKWLEENSVNDTHFLIENLIGILIDGLKDESSNCIKQTLASLNTMLENVIESSSNSHILPLLELFPDIARNPYWLLKVGLCEILWKLPFLELHHISGNNYFQDIALEILMDFLKSDDIRIRNASANAIVEIIQNLYYPDWNTNENTIIAKAIMYEKMYVSSLFGPNVDENLYKKRQIETMPFPFNQNIKQKSQRIEYALSGIILLLSEKLFKATTNHLISGCIETLSILSNKYPPTVYKNAWGSSVNFTGISIDLLNFLVNSLYYSVITYDLNTHSNMLNLATNLYAGQSALHLKPSPEYENTSKLWDMFTSEKFGELSEKYLGHMMKMLNIMHHIVDDIYPNLPHPKPLSTLPSATNTLSPLKRRKSDLDKKTITSTKITGKDDKLEKKEQTKLSNTMGVFTTIPHYMKIYDNLRSAHVNYKVSLESEASEKFLNLLKQTLHAFSVLMEIGGLKEFRRVADDILAYFRSSFHLESTETVACVRQLLKCLFGTNLTATFNDIVKKPIIENGEKIHGFYLNILQKSYKNISGCINNLKPANRIECDSDSTVMGYLHRKTKKLTTTNKNYDAVLASYIRMFEPMVIKSLRNYTITSNIKFQSGVLQLLTQLVQLRVNYCLLDSEQVFIDFVLKQFEFIEEGQLLLAEELIRKIFQFLVQLSYSEYHSKSIIGIPKIIQLCDGLMASGQNPSTHCIPALEPIVEDIFLMRNKSNTNDMKELETTREVVLSMLLKLCDYPKIIDLIVLILEDSRYCSNDPEKWSRWSSQVFNVLLLMLKQNKMRIDDEHAFISLKKLISTLNPEVYQQIDQIVLTLFQVSLNDNCTLTFHNRWLGKVLLLLFILSSVKEDVFLLKIDELKADFSPGNIFENVVEKADPLNVTNSADYFQGIQSEMIFIRFLFRLIKMMSIKCLNIGKMDFLVKEFSVFLLYCSYILQSGNHCKIANYAVEFLKKNKDNGDCLLDLQSINRNFLDLSSIYPILTFQWSYLLILLNCNDRHFWSQTMQSERDGKSEKDLTLNLEIVRVGNCILFCDYMTENLTEFDQLEWLIRNHIKLLIDYSEETPIAEFIGALHRNSIASKIFLENVSKKLEIQDFYFKSKLYKSIENVHPDHYGNLLKQLVIHIPEEIICSKILENLIECKLEFLKNMSKKDVEKQLSQDDLSELIEILTFHKYKKNILSTICLKHGFKLYSGSLSTDYIKKLIIDKKWYISQLKMIYKKKFGQNIAILLKPLQSDDLMEFITYTKYDKRFLKNCLKICSKYSKNFQKYQLIETYFTCILQEMDNILPMETQVYKPWGRTWTDEENAFSSEIDGKFCSNGFITATSDLLSAVIYSMKCINPEEKLPENRANILVKFGVLSLELMNSSLHNLSYFHANFVDLCVNCANAIFIHTKWSILAVDKFVITISSAINCLFQLVNHLLKRNMKLILPFCDYFHYSNDTNVEEQIVKHACYQIHALITWLYNADHEDIPNNLLKPLRNLIINFARLPEFNSFVLVPYKIWNMDWKPDLTGKYFTKIPIVPNEYLEDIAILEEYIYRINLLGWINRQQFEETWMFLLSILCRSPNENADYNEITNGASLAIRTITSLLLQTLYHPIPGNQTSRFLLNISRNSPIIDTSQSIRKLRRIYDILDCKLDESVSFNVFRDKNFEKQNLDYSYGQISVKYLCLATKTYKLVDYEISDEWKHRDNFLENSGLDLNSCLQFLLDYYTQYLNSQSMGSLKILHETVRSIVIISDIFTDKSQMNWMLDMFLNLIKLHPIEDELLHQYLILGICKATAVLTPDLEIYENVRKILMQYLKSSFLPSRIACLYGLLYILEGCKLNNISIGGISDEMQTILPCTIEYIECHINSNNLILKDSMEHTFLIWSLAFYLIENVEEYHFESNFVSNTLQTVFGVLFDDNISVLMFNSFMKALERLVIVKPILFETYKQKLMQLALNRMRNDNPIISIRGTELLLTCMYMESTNYLENLDKSVGIQTNPDHLVLMIEKISAIFERVKKGFASDADVLCTILPEILQDFFTPSDILTKVIGEFLSPYQPNPSLLSGVVFKIFENAIEQKQITLLQDWVVFSLLNFIRAFPVEMATWCLTGFFVCASTNKWLRRLFPFIQTRVGSYAPVDRELLCISGRDFYNNLTNDKQKEKFVSNFRQVDNLQDSPFNDLLNSL